jgi:Fur family ferric uptake transcriptional regulator
MERSGALTAARCAAPATPAAAVDALRAAGRRASAARRLVLEALFAADGPMSADQIAGGIGGRVPCSDVTSVYRNLETLEEVGLVSHVHLGHGPGLYTLNHEGEREWLTCERCGDFRAVDPMLLDEARAAIQAAFGYRASFAHFPVVGLCEACQGAVA